VSAEPLRIEHRVRRSTRARRVRVSVGADGVAEIVLPSRAPAREADAALRALEPWVRRRLRALDRARGDLGWEPGGLPLLDERLVLVEEPGRTRTGRRGDVLCVPAGDAAAPALERWYRAQARTLVAQRLDAACSRAGLRWGPLSIRDQKTRWASCASSGAMSFNWRLLLAPSAVLDTVVWHEVCHLEVADHSPRFRSLLESRCPGHRDVERWLARCGPLLTLGEALATARGERAQPPAPSARASAA
jgi:predicted metal-dependent hydrolase